MCINLTETAVWNTFDHRITRKSEDLTTVIIFFLEMSKIMQKLPFLRFSLNLRSRAFYY